MIKSKALACIAALLAVSPTLCRAIPANPTFGITASNTTMPSNGIGSIPFTLNSSQGFTGQFAVNATAPTVAANVRLPWIDQGGPIAAYTLPANGTVSGSITLLAIKPSVLPVRLNLPPRPAHNKPIIWSLAAVFLLSLSLRNKRSLAAHLSLALCLFIALTTLTACGSGPTLTPGTYTYTLTASEIGVSGLPVQQTTTATLTIPAGIPTNN